MLTSLVLTYFLQLNLIFLLKEDFQKWRESFVKSVVLLFTTVVISTELLSYFSLLKSEVVIGWWIFLNLSTFAYLYFRTRSFKTFLSKFLIEFRLKSVWISDIPKKTIWIFLILIYLTVLFTALFAPPNTVDVLTYHLARVAHWIQSGSVEFYQTSNERQLFNPPLCEYFLLHLQLLAGSDRFANLVQFFSFISCGVVTSLISQRLKLDNFGQLLTVFVSAAIPMAIIQASSSKNDLVTALFVAVFFYYFTKSLDEHKKELFLFAGLSLGLALLTKGTAYFFCLPIGILVFIKSIIQNRLTRVEFNFLIYTFGLLVIAVAINFGHYYRNYQLYKTPLVGEERLRNEKFTLPILFSNVVRNYSIHLGTGFSDTSAIIKTGVAGLLGNELNNPASTIEKQPFDIPSTFTEAYASNLLHIFLLTIGIIYVVFSSGKSEKSELIILASSIIIGFLIFCALLKWNYWVSRVHLPLFFLSSSLIAFLIVKQMNKSRYLIIWGFFISSFFTIYVATPRSLIPYDIDCVYLVPRSELYFSNERNLEPIFVGATDFLKENNVEEIGLHLSTDNVNYNYGDWEYNYFILLKDNFTDKPLIRHIGVDNPSNRLKPDQPMPDWVVSTKKENVIENTEYEVVWVKAPIRILHKKDMTKN